MVLCAPGSGGWYDDERSVLLSELLLRHPELVAEAEEITSTLLVVEDDQELADEITARLRALGASGPVSVDTGRGRVLDVLQPYIDDLTRRNERGARRAAADIAIAVLFGLYECREDTDEDLLLVRMGLPGAADDLARIVYTKVRPLHLSLPSLADECPEWEWLAARWESPRLISVIPERPGVTHRPPWLHPGTTWVLEELGPREVSVMTGWYAEWTSDTSAKAVIAVTLLALLLLVVVVAGPVALLAGVVMMLLGHVVGGLALFGGLDPRRRNSCRSRRHERDAAPAQAGRRAQLRVVQLDGSQYTDVAEPEGGDYTAVVQLDRSEYTEVS